LYSADVNNVLLYVTTEYWSILRSDTCCEACNAHRTLPICLGYVHQRFWSTNTDKTSEISVDMSTGS